MCSSDAIGGEVSEELTVLLARVGELAGVSTEPDGSVSRAEWIERIALVERVRSGVAAAQQAAMVGFARAEAETQMADERIDPQRVGRGIADQVALACRVSPSAGSRRLEVARALWAELPRTRSLLAQGRISENLAEKIVSQTSHLGPDQRRLVDERLAGDGLDELGSKRAEARVRERAYEADREGYVARTRASRRQRRVTVRPAPDAMCWLTLFVPLEQGWRRTRRWGRMPTPVSVMATTSGRGVR